MQSTKKEIGEIIRREERAADGYEYVYELTVNESDRVASFKLPLYSISVKMSKGGEALTYARSGDVFSNEKKAISFFEKIVENLATPIDLAYVLEDSFIT